jgi:hypothetical protein
MSGLSNLLIPGCNYAHLGAGTADSLFALRHSLYSFDGYNPYFPTLNEIPLVEENLGRLKGGQLTLREFLRQTPVFPRWQDEQIKQARILLITNEPGLNDVEQLYCRLAASSNNEQLAACFQQTTLSWLSLTDHPCTGTINGEHPWQQDGTWQQEHPALALFGKSGYFLEQQQEQQQLAGCKALHLELSPFAQQHVLDVNPRNDQDSSYHQENQALVELFCSYATSDQPRYIFIVGNRVAIHRTGPNQLRMDAVSSPYKDKSHKIVDLRRVADCSGSPVHVRICRRWPQHGCDAEVLRVTSVAGYELCPVEG